MITEVSKIREREVVNVCNGKNLGYICDILIDTDCGKIVAIFVSENVFGFGGKNSKRIPWEKITCIGEDTILVSIEDALSQSLASIAETAEIIMFSCTDSGRNACALPVTEDTKTRRYAIICIFSSFFIFKSGKSEKTYKNNTQFRKNTLCLEKIDIDATLWALSASF